MVPVDVLESHQSSMEAVSRGEVPVALATGILTPYQEDEAPVAPGISAPEPAIEPKSSVLPDAGTDVVVSGTPESVKLPTTVVPPGNSGTQL